MRRGPDELARAGSSRKERMSLHAYADTRAGAQMMINAVDDCPGYCPGRMPLVLAACRLPSKVDEGHV